MSPSHERKKRKLREVTCFAKEEVTFKPRFNLRPYAFQVAMLPPGSNLRKQVRIKNIRHLREWGKEGNAYKNW